MNRKKDELRREYSPDLIESGVRSQESGVRGKYAGLHREKDTNLVLIDPDLRELFPDAESVNKALRTYAKQLEKPGS
jgi:hypothetical protein